VSHALPVRRRSLLAFAPEGLSKARQIQEAQTHQLRVILLFALHVPLGVLLYRFPTLSLIHALVVLAVGLTFAVREQFHKVAYVGAYIAGAEVVWRMTENQVLWEYGKYATVLIFLTAIFRIGRAKPNLLMVAFFLLLIPSALMVLFSQGFSDARRALSFNLSGPLALVVSVWFFSSFRLSWEQARRIFMSLLMPLVSIGILTLFVTINSDEIAFNAESNKALSGGFGPNQVSSVLGLGFLIALVVVMLGERNRLLKVLLFAVAFFLGAQSLMTFSRGGIYNALGAAIFGSLFLLRDSRAALKLLAVAALVVVLGLGFIFPRLNKFSGGTLLTRFQDTETTNRGSLVETDVEIFLQNPLLGVGPGQATEYRQRTIGVALPAHTEFTRLLSEHGTFGLIALLLLIAAGVRKFVSSERGISRAFSAVLISWPFLFMTNAGMRLVAPAFIFGLAFVTLQRSYHKKLVRAGRTEVRLKTLADLRTRRRLVSRWLSPGNNAASIASSSQ
jgi:O-antigen ligase